MATARRRVRFRRQELRARPAGRPARQRAARYHRGPRGRRQDPAPLPPPATNCADGSCPVELAGLTDPELLSDTVALRLGLQPARAVGALDAVLDELRGR